MKVVYVSFRRNSPSERYRGRRLLEYLKVTIPSFSYSIIYPGLQGSLRLILKLMQLAFGAASKEIFIFQKIHKATLFSRLCVEVACRSKRCIYDIDDALYAIRPSEVMLELASRCSVVTVGSDEIFGHFSALGMNTVLVPTATPSISPRKTVRGRSLRVGWIGTFFSHRESIRRILLPVLSTIHFPVTVCFAGLENIHDERELQELLGENKNVSFELNSIADWEDDSTVLQYVSSFDVGLSPLIDTTMNRGRSAFKLKQYLACGVPVLASPIGENLKVVRNGENGFLCREPANWSEVLNRFWQMSNEEYQSFRMRARQSYESSDFTVERSAYALFKVFLQLHD